MLKKINYFNYKTLPQSLSDSVTILQEYDTKVRI